MIKVNGIVILNLKRNVVLYYLVIFGHRETTNKDSLVAFLNPNFKECYKEYKKIHSNSRDVKLVVPTLSRPRPTRVHS